jgi:Aminoglycoside-2''-adenylyltransferase
VDADDVIEVLDRLDAAGVECWIDGGWGVDVLLGRQTRTHRDLDLGVCLSDVGRVEAQLPEFRRIETGEWPRFLILEDERGRCVDLALTRDGACPDLALGRIGVREVHCVTLAVQFDRARGTDASALRKRFG